MQWLNFIIIIQVRRVTKNFSGQGSFLRIRVNLITDFCSVKYWKTRIEKNTFDLLTRIHTELEFFDFEENYARLIKKLRHLSLFPVCLHFLICRRSCERKDGYCQQCSRVRENYYFDTKKFQDLVACSGNYCETEHLFLDGKLMDLDVFLDRSVYFNYPNYPLSKEKAKCQYFLVLNHAQDLLAYFCSVLVRMFLNYAMEHFSELISVVSISDEKFIIEEIFRWVRDLLFDFFDRNYTFFYEFLNVFDEVNLSDCYAVSKNKPKFGPYIPRQCKLEIITL